MEQTLNIFLQQRDRWILWAPVAIAIGVGAYFSLHIEPPLWIGPAALVVLMAVAASLHKNRAALLLWLPFFLMALGFTAAEIRTWSVAAPVLERKTYPLQIEGRVAMVEELPQGYRLTLDKVHYDDATQEDMPTHIRLTTKGAGAPPVAGDIVHVKAVLLPLSQPVLPGSYDFQRKAFF